jgi:hypothetical protein
MRHSVRKHYEKPTLFVEMANLGWEELAENDSFPRLDELTSGKEYRALLQRIDRALRSRFPSIEVPDRVPPLFHHSWKKCPRAAWRSFHSYALVRRVFDSLIFLVDARVSQTPGVCWKPVSLQTSRTGNGTMIRIHDPYEDFLAALDGRDLKRLRACPVCKRFFLALRLDQKACAAGCANRLRVQKFRQKKDEYLSNRKFRKRTGLKVVRHGRNQLLALHQALTEVPISTSQAPLLPGPFK